MGQPILLMKTQFSLIVLVMLAASCSVDKTGFVAHIDNPENGLVKSTTVLKEEWSVAYRPLGYQVLVNQPDIISEKFAQVMDENEGQFFLYVKWYKKQGGESASPTSESWLALQQLMTDRSAVALNGARLSPVSCLVDNPHGIRNYIGFLMAFNFTDRPTSDMNITIMHPIENTQAIQVTLDKNDLEDIPDLKF